MSSSFPPSPQWYQAHSACLYNVSNEAGWLLYALNNIVHILDPFTLKYQGALQGGHMARINVLSSRPSVPLSRSKAEQKNEKVDALADPHMATSDSSNSLSKSQEPASESQKALLASGGDDKRVICWDISSQTIVASLIDVHQKEVKAVEWTGDGRLIISGDRGGVLAAWDPIGGKMTTKCLPEKPSISCMASSTSLVDIIAIGLDGGDILVCRVNMSNIAVLTRLHGHSNKIHSLAWQPSALQSRGYTLLSSGSADQTIRIWDIEKVASFKTIHVPDVDETLAPHQRSKMWVPVAWTANGQEIICCTSRGIMVRWSLESGLKNFTRVTRGALHNRPVFQILVWPLGTFAFTISMDRKIIAWDLQSSEGIAQIDCVGGNVYSLDISILDPGRVAMGLGNEAVKVWNTLSQDEPYESVAVERLQSKVKVVRWHPTEEGTLCFGLENGKIGFIEHILNPIGSGTSKRGKKGRGGKQVLQGKLCQTQTIFQSYHAKPVVSMAWCSPKVFEAPVPEFFDLSLRDSTLCIVSCGGEGKILISDSSRPTGKCLDLEIVLQRQNSTWYQSYKAIKGVARPERRDFAVHPNEDLMAIGNSDGSVEVFELKYFKLVYVYQGHKKRVNRLKWNWSAGSSDGTIERSAAESYLLATGSDDGELAIHNLAHFSEKALEEKRNRDKRIKASASPSTPSHASAGASIVLPTVDIYASFRYHTRGISDMAWSPHEYAGESGFRHHQKLVTASFDGKAIVYKIPVGGSTGDYTKSSQDNCAENADNSNKADDTSEDKNVTNTTWDKPQPIACYDQHEGQTLSVCWSLSDVDRVYSGGNDWRTCSWDVKTHSLSVGRLQALKRSGAKTHQKAGGKLAPVDIQQVAPKEVKPDAAEPQSTPDSPHKAMVHVEHQNRYQGPDSLNSVSQAPLQDDRKPEEICVAAKRMSDQHSSDPALLKRARTSSANVSAQQSKLTTNAAVATRINIFPQSSAAFHVHSKQKAHLEIVRLARNLYCRRVRQGGILGSEDELEAARQRWRAMRMFFEKDGEKDGLALSCILGKDVDEMNLADGDQGEDGHEVGMDSIDMSNPANHVEARIEGSNRMEGILARAVEDTSNDTVTEATSSSTKGPDLIESWQGDDSSALNGDLIFYGSRESIKALAEMEAQQMSRGQTGQSPNNIFAVGSGLGVIPPPVSSTRDTTRKTVDAGRLYQIPVSCWMGDVPKMMDIISSLPDSDLGIQDWIGIALSPMGGVVAWKEMMARTAVKFERRGEVHAASLCYLGIGRVADAIQVYRKKNMYREALMLLRIRLWEDEDDGGGEQEKNGEGGRCDDPQHELEVAAEDDGVFNDLEKSGQSQPSLTEDKELSRLRVQILTEWGQQLERKGLYEQACKCQLALAALLRTKTRNSDGSRSRSSKMVKVVQTAPSVGLQTLARRGDLVTLRTVAGLAILLDDPSRQERIARYEDALAEKKEANRRRKTQHV
ncbi:Gem-associated protein 5 [Mortierella polycephala]|uniref:Gem-associated protein 5 n=1 Tax=Mortierella polycephala TaxID=41804 RepID=A0A9P6PXQ9_9FUNG|nr:Gem-associated protein 5 [Mortierella polycephala]